MMTRSMKKKIESQERIFSQEDDKLSNLPNEILIKILSSLETKEVVRTAILSTRWKSLWLSVPTVDIDQSEFRLKGEGDRDNDVKNRFSKYMDQVLLARKFPSLEKLCMSWHEVDHDRVIAWLQAALDRDVRELVVDYISFDYQHLELTDNAFSRNKLVVLKLINKGISLYFPTISSCFPNLKVLELWNVYYKNDESVPNLLSACPVLENLSITRYEYDNMKTLYITSPSLKILKVRTENCRSNDKVAFAVIDAPALEFLDYNIEWDIKGEHVVKDFSSLVEADLSVFCSQNNLFVFLAAISNVKVLKLSRLVMEVLALADPYADSYNLPKFHKLIRLEIEGRYHHGRYDDIFEWSVMLQILKSSPLLDTLVSDITEIQDKELEKSSKLDLPSCLISHLKTIELEINNTNDIEQVRYFLMNAQVLEKMTIRYYFEPYDKSSELELNNAVSKIENGSVSRSENKIVITFH